MSTDNADDGKLDVVADSDRKEEEGPKVSPRKTFLRVFGEMDEVKGWFYAGTFSGLCAGGFMASLAYMFGVLVDILQGSNVRQNAWKLLALYMGIGLAFGFFNFGQFYGFIRVSGIISARLRVSYFNALMNMEKSFYDEKSTGSLAEKLYSNSKVIEQGLGNQLGQFFQFFGMTVGGFFVAFYESWLFTFFLCALLPAVMLGAFIWGKTISALGKEGVDIYEDASSRSLEILSGIQTVKSLSAEASEISTYERLVALAFPLMGRKGLKAGAAFGLMQFINMGFFYGMGMYLGANQIARYYDSKKEEGFSAGQVFGSFFGIFIGGFGLGSLFTAFTDVKEGLAAVQAIYDIIDRVPKIRKPDRGAEPIKMSIKGQISFRNLSFAYSSRPDVNVLQNVTMHINPGQTVAFVGPSGCGKSTIISLIERFYDPEPRTGSITTNGIPIWNIDIENWRSQIGYVGQEPILFDGTITSNILLGTDGKYTREDAIKAAKLANAHRFIEEFPEKYDTKVGEGGGALSGGQKQRIAIARALVREPQILLLDEATSALDTESERVVQEALDRILSEGKRTCILIAHRLSTITNADMIYVFRNGRIVQQGGFKELSNTEGVFYAMLKAQDVLGVDALKKKTTTRDVSQPFSERTASLRSQRSQRQTSIRS